MSTLFLDSWQDISFNMTTWIFSTGVSVTLITINHQFCFDPNSCQGLQKSSEVAVAFHSDTILSIFFKISSVTFPYVSSLHR